MNLNWFQFSKKIIVIMLRRSLTNLQGLFNFCSHTIQPKIQPYLTYRSAQFQKYINENQDKSNHKNYTGSYDQQGSTKFGQRHKDVQMKSWVSDLKMRNSSIGVGTYKGSLDTADDILQFNAVVDSVLSGCNVVDICSNYRGGRSQISVGTALKYLFEQKKYRRNQLLISSKAGYVRQFKSLSAIQKQQLVNQHCVHPLFLQKTLNRTLDKLDLQTLDIFYINNFAQSQLYTLGKTKFEEKLSKAFQFCQNARSQNRIKFYGLASFQNFRLPPHNPLHLNLTHIAKIAEKVGGRNHGFRFLQVPINIQMPQAFAQKNQQSGSLLQTAQNLKINVISCSPLLSGTLINIPLPTDKLNCRNNGAKHLQLIRSIPSPALTCTLIGQKTNRHTKKNLQVLKVPSLTQEEWFTLFVPQQQPILPAQNQQS